MDFGLYRASIQSTFVPVQTKVLFRFPESDSRKPSAMSAETSCTEVFPGRVRGCVRGPGGPRPARALSKS